MNPKYLEVLACPTCKGPLTFDAVAQHLVCSFEKLAYPVKDGIMLLERSHAIDLAEKPTAEKPAE